MRLRPNRLFTSSCLVMRPPINPASMKSTIRRGNATREGDTRSPAQTELRPTSVGAFHVNLPCDVPHEFLTGTDN